MQARLLTTVRVLRVIDGDTVLVRLVCPCCRIESEQRIRLARIDAPELNGPSRGQAIASRDHLASILHGHEVRCCVVRQWPDCYGRVLADLYVPEGNVSDLMMGRGYATPYVARATRREQVSNIA